MKLFLAFFIFSASGAWARTVENEVLIAISHEDTEQVARVIAQSPSLREWRSEFAGSGLLHYAVVSGSLKSLQTLLRLGFNVNQQNKAGLSALHVAAYFDEAEACAALIASGASLTLKNVLGQTAAQVAKARGSEACLKFLSK